MSEDKPKPPEQTGGKKPPGPDAPKPAAKPAEVVTGGDAPPKQAAAKKKDGPVNILLVEDNPRVRRIMEILLIKRGFKISTANDGSAGIQAALQKKPDLLLLDINLPIMDGFDVLKTLRSRKVTEKTPILMLTAIHKDREKVLKALRLGANDFIIQPVPEEELLKRIKKALSKIGRKMPVVKKEPKAEVTQESKILEDIKDKPIGEKIIYIIEESDTIVALPFVISKVLKISRDESAGAKQLAWAISSDTGITAVVLRRANSAYYGKREKIADVSEAVIRMGFNETRNLVLGLSFMKFLSGKGSRGGLNPMEFWKHSLAVGAFSRILASAAKLPQVEIAFTAGLLHDLGKVIMAEYVPEEYTETFEKCRKNDGLIREFEKENLRLTHSEVGYRLGSKWQLPDEITGAIRRHHQPEHPKITTLERVVHLADALAKVYAIGAAGDLYIENTPKETWEPFTLKKGIDKEFTRKVFKEITQAKDFLDITDGELKEIVKTPSYRGDVLFADFSESPEHIARAMLGHMGYRTRNVNDRDKLTKRLCEQQWTLLFVVLGGDSDVTFMAGLKDNAEVKMPDNVICFYTSALDEKIKSTPLPYTCFRLPCSSAKVIQAIGAKQE